MASLCTLFNSSFRLIVGLGCGVGICVAPVYLAECSPPTIVHNVGVLVQLGIVVCLIDVNAGLLHLTVNIVWDHADTGLRIVIRNA